jgi:hypothetical protein
METPQREVRYVRKKIPYKMLKFCRAEKQSHYTLTNIDKKTAKAVATIINITKTANKFIRIKVSPYFNAGIHRIYSNKRPPCMQDDPPPPSET